MNPPPGIEVLPGTNFWLIEGDTHFTVWSKAHGTIITDPHLFRFLEPYLQDVGLVFDIGGCIGDHTRQYLDWGKQVVAFEPNPIAMTCLEHNCPEATCLPYAASDEDGSLNFTILENAGASRITPGGEWSVEAKRIDGLGLPDPGFVKIDCEGWEPRALEGMSQMLARRKPIVFCEINRGALAANGYKPQHITEFMAFLGYTKVRFYPVGARFEDEQFDILFLE